MKLPQLSISARTPSSAPTPRRHHKQNATPYHPLALLGKFTIATTTFILSRATEVQAKKHCFHSGYAYICINRGEKAPPLLNLIAIIAIFFTALYVLEYHPRTIRNAAILTVIALLFLAIDEATIETFDVI